jgi:Tol biopolymer transport system component
VTWTRILVALGVLLVSASADAQYFGRNKVQYDRFDFAILQTPHFDVYYYASERQAAAIAAELAERWYRRLSAALDHTFDRRQPIILYASHSHFAQTSILNGAVADGIGGFTDHLAGRVVLPFAASLGETDHVLGHEIVHAFQRDILKRRGRSLAMLPLWFAEGMAEYLSVRELDANTKMWLRDSADAGKLPTIAQLDDPRWFPYRYGQALWEFVAQTYGENAVTEALTSNAKGGGIGRLKAVTGKDAAALSKEWHAFIRKATAIDRAGCDGEGCRFDAARIIGAEQNGGRMNVAPALSPDGQRVVFLSERDGYSVDVFLADATHGTVIRKMLNAATDAHVDSLQFIDSGGAWDRSGRLFVLATLRDGRAALTVFDMPDGTVRQELPIAGVDQIFSPVWSPDGRRIAFSAMKGGFTDLFVVDVKSGDLRQLTTDPYSDLQPTWSPDGSRIAFATDRFSSSLTALSFGRYQLAVIDVDSGHIQLVGGLADAKNIDPHWSPDGASLEFVSDAGGVSNIYTIDLTTGRTTRVTDVETGVSGITAFSPALSVSADGRHVAFSVYWRGTYEIQTAALTPDDARTVSDDAPLDARTIGSTAASLPPDDDGGSAAPYASRAYVPRLSLAQIGSPYLSAGGGAFGSFVRAGVSVGFGDMLGEQSLDTALQVGKESTDNAIVSTYMNRRSRWNWGVSAGRIPALVGATQSVTNGSDASGAATLERQTNELQQIHRQAAGVVAYPFNRAQRIEASLGVDSIAFEERSTATVYSVATGATLSDVTLHGEGAPTATLVQTGAALVYDTAVFGAASPMLGQRYRVAVAPAFGDIRVVTTVVDYRRYVMPVKPFTIAFRGQSIARLGSGADDPRLLPLIWNMRDVVRGFDTDNATIRTSRYFLGNVELRASLASLLHKDGFASALPIETLAFTDCGRFWMPDATLSASLHATTLCSAGAGTRINAAGFIFEFDAVRPLGPLSQGWRLGINFLPGF